MSQPKWLTEALKTMEGQEHEEMRRMAWTEAADIAMRTAKGFVVPCYNVQTDVYDWIFGDGRFPKLVDPKTGMYFADDPFLERRDDIPLAEFITYLRDWYFPQKLAMHWQAPEKAEV